MSSWNILENYLNEQVIAVPVTSRERYAITEALANITKRMLSEGHSIWPMIESLFEASVPIKGLTDQEVRALRKVQGVGNTPTKQGNTGLVMMLDPLTIKSVKGEMESNKEYYDSIVGGPSGVKDLISKLANSVGLSMGQKAAKETMPPQKSPDLSGDPSDPVPGVEHGMQLSSGGGSPFSSKANVHAQDVASMKGSDPKSAKQQDIDGKLIAPGVGAPDEDPSKWFDESKRFLRVYRMVSESLAEEES